MGTRRERATTICNPGAVVFTMVLGVLLGVISSVVLAVGAHVFHAITNLGVASPSLVSELIFTTVGGVLFSLAAIVGATVALGLTDRRLRYSRFVQGGIAGIGAGLAGLGVFAFLGQTATLYPGGVAGLLAVVAATAFGLMCARANAHTSTTPPTRKFRVRGITL